MNNSRFLIIDHRGLEEVTKYFFSSEKQKLSSQNPIPSEIPFSNEGAIKAFSDEGKLREFVTSRPTPKMAKLPLAKGSSLNRMETIKQGSILALETPLPRQARSPLQASSWNQSARGFAGHVLSGTGKAARCGLTDSQQARSHHCGLGVTAPFPCPHPSTFSRPRHNGASGSLLGPSSALNQSKPLQEEGHGTAVKC